MILRNVLKNFFSNLTLKGATKILLFFLCTYSVSAQDLITESQAAIPPNQNLIPNQIFQDISLIQSSFEASSPFKLANNGTAILNSYQSLVNSGVVLEERTGHLAYILSSKRKNIVLNIPVSSNRFIKLKLEKTDIFTEEFALRYGNSSEDNNTDDAIFYRGIVDKKPLSSAAITITENSVRAVISDEYGNYVLSSLAEHPNKYLLYNEASLNNSIPFDKCGADNALPAPGGKVLDLERGIKRTQKGAGDCVEIYIECDYSVYEAHNYSINSVKAYVTALFNEVSLIYYNERINIYLSDLYVWTTPDPYQNFTTSYTMLDGFGGQIKNNYNGRLAHLLTRRNLGEGGRAWIDGLCESHYTFETDFNNDGVPEIRNAGPYGVSTVYSNNVVPFNTYSWDVFILAHELGHNFGSPHTQACKWGPNGDQALDNCWTTEGGCADGPEPVNGGTIMSYCNSGYAYYNYGINFKNGFGTEPGNLIRSNVNNANCLSECPCGARSNKDVNIFEDYSWLSSYVNQNNCNNEVVTLYNGGGSNYIYVENSTGGTLYNQDGRRYCTNRPGLDCITFYNLNQIEGSWACSEASVDCGIGGCTDTDACNYNPQAEFNDGSCDFGVTNCSNPCSASLGCANPAALNYNSNATCDDGSCEFPVGCDADIFTNYAWLNNIVNQTNCTNEKITLYKKGAFNYLLVEYDNEDVLYFSSGIRYCSDSKDGFCVNAYDLSEVEKSWRCGACIDSGCTPVSCSTDPCTNGGVYAWNSSSCSCELTESTVRGCDDPAATNYNTNANCIDNSLCTYAEESDCNDTSLFSTFSWLNSMVNRNGCTDESVTRYDVGRISYIYITTGNTGFLRYENGNRACSDSGDGRCPQIYNLTNIGACWSCGGGGQTPVFGCTDPSACNYNSSATVNDNSCNFGNQNCSSPCNPVVGCTDSNACNYNSNACVSNNTCDYQSCENCNQYTGTVFYDECNGGRYYLIRLTDGTILDPYNDEAVNFEYPDGAIINFNYSNLSKSDFCTLADRAVLITCVEVIGNDNDAIFNEYSFLRSVIDPVSCNSGAYVEVFQFSGFSYLYVYDGQNGKLYFSDGTRYCSDRQNRNCKDLYNLDNVTSRWDCKQNAAKRSKILPALEVEIFPNPNDGAFTFNINNEVDLENASIKIYNTSGQAMQTLENVSFSNQVNISTYGKGLYWISLLTKNESIIKKVVVE